MSLLASRFCLALSWVFWVAYDRLWDSDAPKWRQELGYMALNVRGRLDRLGFRLQAKA